ncbi:hypothetical protein [Marinicella litoralis]|uniref:Uncharacterized protein n=1 Tax=Marinicella litoralis TaxID=644220 RepID=A0A4R6XK07_9GAMM|nr:hypothetical protein [Marinicella litoralis]TDR16298.1 hypothetical protein C8D91_2825 [Marinicella litoralis]
MSEFLSSHELINLEEELRAADQALYVNKNSKEGLAKSFKALSLRTGWAIYLWDNDQGLMNLKSSEPPAPKTKSFNEAIKFALARKHFSVFIFPINDKDSWLEAKVYFTSNPDKFDGVVKCLFILANDKEHPFLLKSGKLVKLNMGLDGNFVLRDGSWISANDIP